MVNKLDELMHGLGFERIVIGNELKGELEAMVEGKRIAMMIEDCIEEMVEMVGQCGTFEGLQEVEAMLNGEINRHIGGIERYLEDDIEDLVKEAFEECDTVIQINGMEDALKNMIEDQASERTRRVDA